MATLTTILSLRKPDNADFVNHTTDLNANWDLVDALFNTTTGHKHTGAGTNGPVVTINESQVIYDATEAATNDTLTGASMLINNMNRIRYWMSQISGVGWTTAIGTSLATHVGAFHPTAFGSVVAIGTANADGSGTTDTHANHVHSHGALGTIANAHAAADITNAASLIATNTFTKQYVATPFNFTFSATPTIDWNNSNVQYTTMTGNITTLTLSNPIEGGRYMLQLIQDGTGGRTVVWPAAVHWPGGTAPTLSAASKVDVFGFLYRGGVYYGTSALNYA